MISDIIDHIINVCSVAMLCVRQNMSSALTLTKERQIDHTSAGRMCVLVYAQYIQIIYMGVCNSK